MMVCAASPEGRSRCDSRCGDCRFFVAERRQRPGRFAWLAINRSERRSRSNWLPQNYRLAGIGGAVAVSLEERSDSKNLPVILLALLVLFNLLDSLLTARALSLGVAEANPVMAELFNASVPLGMAYKTVIVALGALLLLRYRHLVLALRGLTFLTGCYGLVVLYHLYFQLLA